MAMPRSQVVQALLDRFEAPRYLEIGVCHGSTFHKVSAASKIGIDPAFRFDVEDAARDHPTATYISKTSDAYFASLARDVLFDVIFIDGLHTFDQTLRDLMNSLAHVHERSLIAIDDIYPSSFAASLPDPRQSNRARKALGIESGAWMGDVYRLVLFIESFLPAWDYRCVSENHGQLIMWRASRPAVAARTVRDIAAAGYEQVVLGAEAFRFLPLAEIMEMVDVVRSD